MFIEFRHIYVNIIEYKKVINLYLYFFVLIIKT